MRKTKKIFTGRNSAVLFLDNDLSRGYNSKLVYNEDKIVLPADVKDEDLPTFRDDGDFRYFNFRHISKTIVGAHSWKATDFSVGNVLKNSTQMLHKKPAYKQHWAWVGNALGQVVNPMWVNEYTNSQGQEIPAGIDAEFAINKNIKSLEELVQHLSSKHNPYDAASVGIVFQWEASHKFETMWDFYDHLGQEIEDEDGKKTMVRRIATLVEDYHESSLVAYGADFYARQKDGNNEVRYSKDDAIGGIALSDENPYFKEEFEKNGKYFVYSSGIPSKKFDKSKEKPKKPLDLSKEKNSPDMEKEKLVAFAVALLGYKSFDEIGEGVEIPQVNEGVTFKSLQEASKKVVAFEADQTIAKVSYDKAVAEKEASDVRVVELTKVCKDKQEEVDALKLQVSEAAEKVKYSDQYREGLIAKAKAVYTAKQNGDPSDLILKEFENNSIPVLEDKIKAYGGNVGFSGACKDCGSSNFEFRSSKEAEVKTDALDNVDTEDDFSLRNAID